MCSEPLENRSGTMTEIDRQSGQNGAEKQTRPPLETAYAVAVGTRRREPWYCRVGRTPRYMHLPLLAK